VFLVVPHEGRDTFVAGYSHTAQPVCEARRLVAQFTVGDLSTAFARRGSDAPIAMLIDRVAQDLRDGERALRHRAQH
jgi:hypothetical protein